MTIITGGAAPTDRYSKGWTACTSGADNYCDTGDAFADMKDDSTGLIWSKPCSGSGCASSAEPADTVYTWNNSGGNNNSLTAYQLCSQDLGTTHDEGWFLPHQKQLMQAYIDGSYGNLDTFCGSPLLVSHFAVGRPLERLVFYLVHRLFLCHREVL